MDFNKLANSRMSIRSFKAVGVSDEIIAKLIEAAQAAPSAGNGQPWFFCVVKSAEIKKRISAEATGQPFIATAPLVIVVFIDKSLIPERYGKRGEMLYCIQDTAAAVQNILLCAESLGLGACWCGAFDEETVTEILSLREGLRPVSVIPVGYTDKRPDKRKRRPVEDIFTVI